MPISINGTGTITGISAGGLPDDCITTAEIAGSSVTTAKITDANITYGKLSTSATEADNVAKRTAKAWVNFNGTGTVAIRSSFNVSSITDNGVGVYTVNFSIALENADYCWSLNGRSASGAGFYTFSNGDVAVPTANAFAFLTLAAANSGTADQSFVTATFFK